VTVQGNCSYSVYAGPDLEFVIQFRLKTLVLKSDTAALAREIYGSLAPETSFHGQVGDGKEPLFVYVMNRIRGISQLDFILAHSFPENSEDNFLWRKNLMSDLARYGSPSLVPYTPNGTTTMPLFSYGRVLIYCRFFASPGRPLRRSIQLTVRFYAEHIPRICSYYSTIYHSDSTRSYSNVWIQWRQFSLFRWFFPIVILTAAILWLIAHLAT
jgi:hypothetical protein